MCVIFQNSFPSIAVLVLWSYDVVLILVYQNVVSYVRMDSLEGRKVSLLFTELARRISLNHHPVLIVHLLVQSLKVFGG